MEKYGVDFSELPVTSEQMEKIACLQKTGKVFPLPKNRKGAEEVIEKYGETH